MSNTDLYAVRFATELLCLRDCSHVLTDDAFSKAELNDLLLTALCDYSFYSDYNTVPFFALSCIFDAAIAMFSVVGLCVCLYILYEWRQQ